MYFNFMPEYEQSHTMNIAYVNSMYIKHVYCTLLCSYRPDTCCMK